ncbi:hypothetical protein JMN32_25160 [Fulvivirga sp. 29W222]|uniref:Uncharacterized protein n=1 Tax=Fulvivirga marina TaxID=2494733 RepID=A0A937G440_9BACT|nr:hypothetical protein [Fulvivirga marina]MBL6449625.1 hypothetical protein [Fulvivirga marina]
MNKIILLFFSLFLFTFSQASSSETTSCNCELINFGYEYFDERITEIQNDIQIKDLTNTELEQITKRLCIKVIEAGITGFKSEEFKRLIHEALNTPNDLKESNKNMIIVAFLNKYKQKLICPKVTGKTDSRDMLIYKKAALEGIVDLYDEILLDNEAFPNIDFNGYEIVDGNKETVVDYIDYLIKTVLYDKDELELLRDDIIDYGGKRGVEL